MLANLFSLVNGTFHKIVCPNGTSISRFVGKFTKMNFPLFCARICLPAFAVSIPRTGSAYACRSHFMRRPEMVRLPPAALSYCFSSTTVTPSSPSPYRPRRKDLTAGCRLSC